MKKSGVRGQGLKKQSADNNRQFCRLGQAQQTQHGLMGALRFTHPTTRPLPLIILFTLYLSLLTILSSCSPPPGTRGTQPTVKIGEPAFPFTLNLISNETAALDTFKGKPLVITFMSSWCPCSNESAPVFKEVYNKYHPQGVEILMIDIQDSERKFKKFFNKHNFPFHGGFDKGDKIAQLYGVNAPPTTFFITKDGKIKRAFYGKIVETDKLSKWVEEIL